MKYPIEPGLGGVSREWLVRQIDRAPYPNLLLEVALHPLFPCTLANFANVTEEVLVDCLLGEDTLSTAEFNGLLRGLGRFLPVSADYLMQPTVQLYSLSNRKHRQKIRRIAAMDISIYECVYRPIAVLRERGMWPCAALRSVLRFAEKKAEDIRFKEAFKPRTRKHKEATEA